MTLNKIFTTFDSKRSSLTSAYERFKAKTSLTIKQKISEYSSIAHNKFDSLGMVFTNASEVLLDDFMEHRAKYEEAATKFVFSEDILLHVSETDAGYIKDALDNLTDDGQTSTVTIITDSNGFIYNIEPDGKGGYHYIVAPIDGVEQTIPLLRWRDDGSADLNPLAFPYNWEPPTSEEEAINESGEVDIYTGSTIITGDSDVPAIIGDTVNDNINDFLNRVGIVTEEVTIKGKLAAIAQHYNIQYMPVDIGGSLTQIYTETGGVGAGGNSLSRTHYAFPFYSILSDLITNVSITDAMVDVSGAITVEDPSAYINQLISSTSAGLDATSRPNLAKMEIYKNVLPFAQQGGQQGVCSYLESALAAPGDAEIEGSFLTLTNNANLVPVEYLSGVLHLVSMGVSALGVALAAVTYGISAILSTLVSTVLSTIQNVINADKQSETVSMASGYKSAANGAITLAYANVLPISPAATFQVDDVEMTDQLHEIIQSANGSGCLAVPGGMMFIGQNSSGKYAMEFHPYFCPFDPLVMSESSIPTHLEQLNDLLNNAWIVDAELAENNPYLSYSFTSTVKCLLPTPRYKPIVEQLWSIISDICFGSGDKNASAILAKHYNESIDVFIADREKATCASVCMCTAIFALWWSTMSVGAGSYEDGMMLPLCSTSYSSELVTLTNASIAMSGMGIINTLFDEARKYHSGLFDQWDVTSFIYVLPVIEFNNSDWDLVGPHINGGYVGLYGITNRYGSAIYSQSKNFMWIKNSPYADSRIYTVPYVIETYLDDFRSPVAFPSDWEYAYTTPKYRSGSVVRNIILASVAIAAAAAIAVAATVTFKQFAKKKRAANVAKASQAQSDYQTAVNGTITKYDDQGQPYDYNFDPNSAEGQQIINQKFKAYKKVAFKNNMWAKVVGGSSYDVSSFYGDKVEDDCSSGFSSYLSLPDISSKLGFGDLTLSSEDQSAISMSEIMRLISGYTPSQN